MKIPVGLPPAHGKGRNGLAAVQVLLRVVYHAALHEVNDAVGQQLGVDAQMLLLRELAEDRIGDASIPDLDGVPVLYNAGHVIADPLS